MNVCVPGDKSISQRALILAALAEGQSRLRGVSTGADALATAAVLRRLGVSVRADPDTPGGLLVAGRGLRGLDAAGATLDCGNSGTCARLMLGVLAGQGGSATLTGDASLRSRPMRRVTGPLERMGGRFDWLDRPDRLPVRVRGGPLRSVDEIETEVASAQVKSAILLAALVSGQSVALIEPGRSRDHTERMLTALGAPVRSRPDPQGWRVELPSPPAELRPLDLDVPGDVSAAAFLLVLGLLGGGGPGFTVSGCGLNPTRTGVLAVLRRMGGVLDVEPRGAADEGDPTGDVHVRPADLRATAIGPEEMPGLVDEIPVLAAAASRAEGTTRIRGAGELRVKETDRIAALVANLRTLGVRVTERDDGLDIEGTARPLRGDVRAFGDHRIAMAFGVLGALPGNEIRVDEPGVADVSFPGFWRLVARLGERAG